MDAILEVSDLRAGYATGDVLQGVSVSVGQGEVVGVLGRNGVGKSTLMRSVIGLLRARRGTIRFKGRGRDGRGRRPPGAARHGLRPAGARDLPAHDRCSTTCAWAGSSTRRAAASRSTRSTAISRSSRSGRAQRGGTLSGGQQEMLAIARALVERARAAAARRAVRRRPALDRAGDRRLHRRAGADGSRSACSRRAEHRPHADRGAAGLRHGQGPGRRLDRPATSCSTPSASAEFLAV